MVKVTRGLEDMVRDFAEAARGSATGNCLVEFSVAQLGIALYCRFVDYKTECKDSCTFWSWENE